MITIRGDQKWGLVCMEAKVTSVSDLSPCKGIFNISPFKGILNLYPFKYELVSFSLQQFLLHGVIVSCRRSTKAFRCSSVRGLL